MRGPFAILAGLGVPLGLCGLLCLAVRGTPWLVSAAKLGLASSMTLGAFGALVGVLAARRRVSGTPVRDALVVASIVPGLLGFVAALAGSHELGMAAGLVMGALVFLPGPLAGYVSARLATLSGEDPEPPPAP